MTLKRRRLKSSLLCVIIDRQVCTGRKALAVARQAARAGAGMIQLRDKGSSTVSMLKTARALKRIASAYRIPFIINDRIDVAVAADSDGIHVGQGDMAVPAVRRLLGRGKILGVSARTVAQARRAQRCGAAYVGAGPVFTTPLKKGERAIGVRRLEQIRRTGVPVMAIGGIDRATVAQVVRKGFRRVAVIRAVSDSHDPFCAAMELRKALEQ